MDTAIDTAVQFLTSKHKEMEKMLEKRAKGQAIQAAQMEFLKEHDFDPREDFPFHYCYMCEKWVPAPTIGHCPVCFTLNEY